LELLKRSYKNRVGIWIEVEPRNVPEQMKHE
jgi:hypothetical protein